MSDSVILATALHMLQFSRFSLWLDVFCWQWTLSSFLFVEFQGHLCLHRVLGKCLCSAPFKQGKNEQKWRDPAFVFAVGCETTISTWMARCHKQRFVLLVSCFMPPAGAMNYQFKAKVILVRHCWSQAWVGTNSKCGKVLRSRHLCLIPSPSRCGLHSANIVEL